MLTPVARALDQMTDPIFLGVVAHSVVWSAVAFVGLATGLFYGGQALIAGQGVLGTILGAAGAVGTAIASIWLFLPLATVIASFFIERISIAVERRWYPDLPPPQPASLVAQLGDGVGLGLRVLAMQAVALAATLVPPHVTGLVIGWLVASWAVGRGLFVPVAMLRMTREQAILLYRRQRLSVLSLGALITAAGLVPVLNLLAPVLGVAAMVHLLHQTSQGAGRVVAGEPRVLGQPRPRSVL